MGIEVGIGNKNAALKVYIANRPPLDEYLQLNYIRPIRQGEIGLIAEQTGNHWRKIFNCFAKLFFQLEPTDESSWQQFRDNHLLGQHSNQLLLFSRPDFSKQHFSEPLLSRQPTSLKQKPIHLICGKTYFTQLNLGIAVEWVDNYFAINSKQRLIVCPYFDYRQLSNQRIEQLVGLIHHISNKSFTNL
jgi:hypothetical protein